MTTPVTAIQMNPAVLLAELRRMAENAPDFGSYRPDSKPHLVWLGRTHALINRWNTTECRSFRLAADFLGMELTRESNVAQLFGILHRAIADLELQHVGTPDQVFGPGAVYDFFKALRDLLGSATQSIFVIDPYLDETVADHYLTAIPHGVRTRLLCRNKYPALVPAVEKFSAQFGHPVELRSSDTLHDRILFVDGGSCWVLGMSIRDALTKGRTTYLAPLSPDVTTLKADEYERIWTAGSLLSPAGSIDG